MPGTPLCDIRYVENDELAGADEAEIEDGVREEVEVVEQMGIELITAAQPMAHEDRIVNNFHENEEDDNGSNDGDNDDNGNDAGNDRNLIEHEEYIELELLPSP